MSWLVSNELACPFDARSVLKRQMGGGEGNRIKIGGPFFLPPPSLLPSVVCLGMCNCTAGCCHGIDMSFVMGRDGNQRWIRSFHNKYYRQVEFLEKAQLETMLQASYLSIKTCTNDFHYPRHSHELVKTHNNAKAYQASPMETINRQLSCN